MKRNKDWVRETVYAYGNAAWKDQLTGFGGKAITYDAIGNPLTYGQRNERTFTWQGGRRLAHMTVRPDAAEHGEAWVELDAMDIYHAEGDNGARFVAIGGELDASIEGYRLQNGWLEVDGVSEALALDFAYDAAGLRTQKAATTDDGAVTTTDYFLHGKLLMEMQEQGPSGAKRLHFYYDATGKPQMVKLGDNYYTYLHNLQGDIVAIVDSVGSTVVEYGYDAWGKPTKTASKVVEGDSTLTTEYAELARLNPFRYRGYVYDAETGYYYLRTRYYDPNWGRFINMDSLAGNVGKLLSHNTYAYSKNAPVKHVDRDGQQETTTYYTPSYGQVLAVLMLIRGITGHNVGPANSVTISITTGNKITIAERDAHNETADKVMMYGAMLYGSVATFSVTPMKGLHKILTSGAGGFATGLVSDKIQSELASWFKVEAGNYTSIRADFRNDNMILGFIPDPTVSNYEIRIYDTGYCEVWHAYTARNSPTVYTKVAYYDPLNE